MRFKRQEITVISENTSFQGKLETAGGLTILGSFKGDIKTKTLEIFKGGKAIGSIEAENITISGYFEGEIICHNVLTIAKAAQVKGKAAYGTLSVEPGGLLDAEIFHLESTDTTVVPFYSQKVHSEEK